MKSTTSSRSCAIVLAALLGSSPLLLADPNGKRVDTRDPDDAPSSTQIQQSYDQNTSRRDKQTRMRNASTDPRGQKAGDLLGSDVYGNGGERLGTLKDLAVDSRSGKILFAIVSSGGLGGVGGDLRAVPIEHVTAGSDRVTIDIGENRWKQAPVFTRDQLLTLNRQGRDDEVREFFGTRGAQREHSEKQPWSFGKIVQNQQNEQKPPQLVMVSDLRGKDIHRGGTERGEAGHQIGEIEDVIVQMKNHGAAALVDFNDNFAGGDRNYLVPLSKFQGFNTANLRANLTRQDLDDARSSDDDSWSQPVGSLGSLYVWPVYGRNGGFPRDSEPQVGASGDNRSFRERAKDLMNNERDRSQSQAPLSEVRQAIRDAAPNAQGSIIVEAEQDKIVLRGTVPNNDVKDRIEDRAARAANNWEIDSRIRVAPGSR